MQRHRLISLVPSLSLLGLCSNETGIDLNIHFASLSFLIIAALQNYVRSKASKASAVLWELLIKLKFHSHYLTGAQREPH